MRKGRKKSTAKQHWDKGSWRNTKQLLSLLFGNVPAWAIWAGGAFITLLYFLVFYSIFVNPFSFRWKALYGDTKFHDYSIQGIDISRYQGKIDWYKLNRTTIGGTPITFIFIKSTEGETLVDKFFEENFANACRYDYIRGAYHFFAPSVAPEKQAQHYIRTVKLLPGDLPPVLDFEIKGDLKPAEIKAHALKWLKMVEQHYGVKPILYTSYKFKEQYFSDSVFDAYPYWIAHYYVDDLQYKGPWRFWQHTDRGRLDGIDEYVDFNVYNGSMYDLQKLTIQDKEEIQEDV